MKVHVFMSNSASSFEDEIGGMKMMNRKQLTRIARRGSGRAAQIAGKLAGNMKDTQVELQEIRQELIDLRDRAHAHINEANRIDVIDMKSYEKMAQKQRLAQEVYEEMGDLAKEYGFTLYDFDDPKQWAFPSDQQKGEFRRQRNARSQMSKYSTSDRLNQLLADKYQALRDLVNSGVVETVDLDVMEDLENFYNTKVSATKSRKMSPEELKQASQRMDHFYQALFRSNNRRVYGRN